MYKRAYYVHQPGAFVHTRAIATFQHFSLLMIPCTIPTPVTTIILTVLYSILYAVGRFQINVAVMTIYMVYA